MPEPAVVTAMREFKQGLLRREAGQMQEMAQRWLGVEVVLQGEIDALTWEFAQRRDGGKTISAGAAYRMERYKRLLGQTQAQFGEYAAWAGDRVTREQADYGNLGADHATQAINLSYWDGGRVAPTFDRLPIEAIERMAGLAGDGRSVGDLLKRRMLPGGGPLGWQGLTQALIDGTALGRNPRTVAREMADSLTEGLQKALVIARTEQLRVYRRAGLEQYRASGVVGGQKRLSAHDGRVCAACLADDGKLYSLNATISDHPSGRCTAIPVVDGMPEVNWLSGEAWFRTQSPDVQRSILGPGRLDAYNARLFDFGDLVTRTSDSVWGAGLTSTPLCRLVGG